MTKKPTPRFSHGTERFERKRALALALRGGRHLLARAEETTHGLRFRAAEAAIKAGQPAYPADLYDGAAGVALTLHDLHTATGERRWLSLAEDVADGLRESAPGDLNGQQTGLYLGQGGVLLLHLRRAIRRGDPGAVEEMRRLGDQLRDGPIHVCDLLYGAAGTGLAQLALFQATRDPKVRAGVRRCLEFLQTKAVPWGAGLAWPAGNPIDRPRPAGDKGEPDGRLSTGFAHGIAGVAVFLLEASTALPRETIARDLCAGAFSTLEHTAIRGEATVAWPSSDQNPLMRFHWCEGTTGIAQAFLARYRHTRDPRSLETARGAGLHTWRAMGGAGGAWKDRYACHCHGLAGALELFADLHEHGAGPEWWTRAVAVGRHIQELAGPGSGPSALGGDGCGLGYGTAGVVRALLRLAGQAAAAPWVLDGPRINVPLRRPSTPLLPQFLRGARRNATGTTRRGPATPAPRRSVLWPSASFVPGVAARLRDSGMVAPLGPEWDRAARRFARRFFAAAESEPLHRAADVLEKQLRVLRVRHRDLVAPPALALVAHGHFLRRIAGLALQGGAVAARHRAEAAERMAAGYGAALAQCLQRVARDQKGALAGVVGGRVLQCNPLGNDPHRGGEVAVGLAFEHGAPLIYKPRPVRLDWFLAGGNPTGEGSSAAELVNRWLPERIPGARLPTHDLIAAGPWHGYAERVATAAVPMRHQEEDRFERADFGRPTPELATRLTPGDDTRFWYTAGLLVGQVAGFGIGDLHAENIVCGTTRSSPRVAYHAVDLEVAFLQEGGAGNAHLTPLYGSFVAPPDHSHFGLQARPSRHCSMGAEEWALEMTDAGPRPMNQPGGVVSRFLPNAVENSDGSFGYGQHLCAVVRGLVDHWETVRAHARAMQSAVRDGLSGCRVRVLAKASIAYLAPLRRRQLGTRLWTGAADFQGFGEAAPFSAAERKQLDAFDVPYFSRCLGRRKVEWIDRPPGGKAPADPMEYTVLRDPFWSVVDHYAHVAQLAHAIADLVAYAAPRGPFDQRDDALAVRVVRQAGDARPRVVVVLRDGPRVFQLQGDGVIRWWRQ